MLLALLLRKQGDLPSVFALDYSILAATELPLRAWSSHNEFGLTRLENKEKLRFLVKAWDLSRSGAFLKWFLERTEIQTLVVQLGHLAGQLQALECFFFCQKATPWKFSRLALKCLAPLNESCAVTILPTRWCSTHIEFFSGSAALCWYGIFGFVINCLGYYCN